MLTLLRKEMVTPRQINYLLLGIFLLTAPFDTQAQITELVNQVNAAEQGASQIGNSIFRFIKVAAAVLIGIAAVTFLIVREQSQDLTKKVGNIIVGLVIFYGLLEIGENLSR